MITQLSNCSRPAVDWSYLSAVTGRIIRQAGQLIGKAPHVLGLSESHMREVLRFLTEEVGARSDDCA